MNTSALTDEEYARRELARARRAHAAWRGVLGIAAAVCVLAALFQWVLGVAVVTGDAMAPTMSEGAVVLYLRIPGEIQRGDAVLAELPGAGRVIRRAAAVGGDVLEIGADGAVRVNGAEESAVWVVGRTYPRDGKDVKLTMGAQDVYLLGDARERAYDSRDTGAVRQGQICGRVLAVWTAYPLDWVDWLIEKIAA